MRVKKALVVADHRVRWSWLGDLSSRAVVVLERTICQRNEFALGTKRYEEYVSFPELDTGTQIAERLATKREGTVYRSVTSDPTDKVTREVVTKQLGVMQDQRLGL
jgi:hypothetical protein